ncbi:WD40-repeat-containing domain protein [Cokeromyces recurvatus]|uniref:WD40-repeat-containing domain protein n=1 Tax=Cokeromyces recurvatus TaxID=90255 RepID=UPI00222111FD|nr:WD40-repeat-containing domain protein [Cokeromyces recurvatus]KAI7901910.1 WD40-repeat-containing domain protein [Cokeromyces recurvatus]
MSFLYTTPDIHFGTVAELNGSLVHVDNANSSALQEVHDNHTPLYPSITIQPFEQLTPDYINSTDEEASSYLEVLHNKAKSLLVQQWEENRPTIEATTVYKEGKRIYDYIYNKYLKTSSPALEHSMFQTESGNVIRSIAWHPHQDILAVAYKDDQVYIYEKKNSKWTCQVLSHMKMKDITCLEWKPKASGLLAVGCKEGVCVWTVEKVIEEDEEPHKHPSATMTYLSYPKHDYISAIAWDPTPGSHLLAVASAVTSTLVIYDLLLNRTIPLKRYGKGDILLRWSPSGEWLFEGGCAGVSRLWNTRDWTSKQIYNPPGVWVQTACWAPNNRILFYSMYGESDIHVLFLAGPSVQSVVDVKVLSTPSTLVESATGASVKVGGTIRDISIDIRNGQRLAVAFEDSNLIALYSLKQVSPLSLTEEAMLFPM